MPRARSKGGDGQCLPIAHRTPAASNAVSSAWPPIRAARIPSADIARQRDRWRAGHFGGAERSCPLQDLSGSPVVFEGGTCSCEEGGAASPASAAGLSVAAPAVLVGVFTRSSLKLPNVQGGRSSVCPLLQLIWDPRDHGQLPPVLFDPSCRERQGHLGFRTRGEPLTHVPAHLHRRPAARGRPVLACPAFAASGPALIGSASRGVVDRLSVPLSDAATSLQHTICARWCGRNAYCEDAAGLSTRWPSPSGHDAHAGNTWRLQ